MLKSAASRMRPATASGDGMGLEISIAKDVLEKISPVFTDGLARIFTLPLPALGLARSVGMTAFDLLPPAKRLLTRLTMGRSGRTPRLVRGLPL